MGDIYSYVQKTMEQSELKTQRLILRPFLIGDAYEINKLVGNINVAKTTLNIPHPYSVEMAKSWIATHKPGWAAKKNVVYAITLSTTGKLVGAIGLHDVEPLRAELGYWVGEPYWGNGYCTEAAKAIVNFSFENLKLKSVISRHLTSNPASGEVMKKVGMKHIQQIQSRDRNGNLANVEVYVIEST